MDLQAGNLLIVDDNEDVRDILSMRLQKFGHIIDVAPDGSAALELMEEKSYDLILLDIHMPGMDGLATLKEIRKRHQPVDLPILMVTSRDDTETISEALEFGANGYVEKPLVIGIDVDSLNSEISSLLALKRLQ